MLAHEILSEEVWRAEERNPDRLWVEWLTGMTITEIPTRWACWSGVSAVFRQVRYGETALSCCACRGEVSVTTGLYLHAMLQYNAPHVCPRRSDAARA